MKRRRITRPVGTLESREETQTSEVSRQEHLFSTCSCSLHCNLQSEREMHAPVRFSEGSLRHSIVNIEQRETRGVEQIRKPAKSKDGKLNILDLARYERSKA